jgi:outer membrane protein assembly factor BamB
MDAAWALAVAVSMLLATTPAARADWGTFGYTPARSGYNPNEHTLTPANVGSLREAWSTYLGGIRGQPIVVASVRLSTTETADVVYAGTEGGRFAAVRAADGGVLWKRTFGVADVPECHATYGVTSTPALDRSRNGLYVVDGLGILRELDLATGATKRSWTITTNTKHEHVWSGLTLANGILYVPVGGECDNPPYHGRVVAIDADTGKRISTWYVTGRGGPDGGGIWGWGGVSVDPAKHAVYAASGNSVTHKEHDGYAEHVVRLSEHLKVKASDYPGLPHGDADFGGGVLLYHVGGCPPQLAVGNKFGQLYVYNRNRIGHGPSQTLALGGSGDGSDALLSVPAAWTAKRLVYVPNPSTRGGYKRGMLALRVTSSCRLKLAWHASGPGRNTGGATVANGVVFYGDGFDGKLVAFDALTGKRLWTSRSAVGGPVFNAPVVAGGTVYTGSWDARLHAFRLASSAPAR